MDNVTIKEAIDRACSMLKEVAQKPKLEAYILLSHLLKKERVWLLLHEDYTLENYEEYLSLVKRRQLHEPIEYISNSVSFYKELFYISKGALIPRPETELLVDFALKFAKKFKKDIKIAEIGTGSGVVSIMLAKMIKNAKIVATDISKDALAIAKINAKRFGVQEKIEFINTEYLKGVDEDFDMIVSNPPYIAKEYKIEENLKYEPKIALFGGEKGDEVLKKVIDIALEKKVKYLVCEMGYDQKKSMSEFMSSRKIKDFAFYKDLAGFDRGFMVELVDIS